MASTKPFWQQESQYQHYRSGKWFGTHNAQVIILTCLTAATVFIYDGLQVKHDPLYQTLGCSAVIIVIETNGVSLTELTILAKPPVRSTTPGWSIFNVTKIQTNRSFCHVSKTHFVHTCACLTNQV